MALEETVMTWFWVALGCAFFTASTDAVSKRIMKGSDEWFTGAIILSGACALVFPVFINCDIRPFSNELVKIIVLAAPLEILGYYLFLRAINIGPISVTLPLLAFTPVFTLVSSFVILGENVSFHAGLGIFMVTIGAYIMNLGALSQGILGPIRALLSSPASRKMLLVALIWSVTSVLGRKGATLHGPIQYGFTIETLILIGFIIIALFRRRIGLSRYEISKTYIPWFCLGFVLMAMAQVTHFVALSMAPAPYMISVKRLSLVFGVILGWIFFKETEIRFRLAGTIIMISGVWVIYLKTIQ